MEHKSARTDQQETGVHQTEGAGAADASRAMHHGRPHRGLQGPRGPHALQEAQEHCGTLRHSKVWPGRVVELQDLSAVVAVQLR